MKIAIACNEGGHLTEAQLLSGAFKGHETFYLTYESLRGRELDEQKYLIHQIKTNPFWMLVGFVRICLILLRERPDMLVSTGGEISIPSIVAATLLQIETVYIESWCRSSTRSVSGRIAYHLVDTFLVQWPELAEVYGEKARYEGAVL